MTQLPGVLGAGVNYYAYFPKLTSDLEVVNSGALPTALLVYLRGADGEWDTVIRHVGAGKSDRLTAALFTEAEEGYVLSLQPFSAVAAEPFEIAGVKSRALNVVKPDYRLNLTQVETPDGQLITVGLDARERAHYPVYVPGRAFGSWSSEDNAVIQEDSGVMLLRPLEK